MKKYNWLTLNILFFVLLLFIIPFLTSFELVIAVLLILTLFLANKKGLIISRDIITALLPLLIIFLIGISITIFYSYSFRDIGKDLAYFIKPILLLFIGYSLIYSINDKSFFFKIFVYSGIAYALWHLYNMAIFPDLINSSISDLRNKTGLSNDIELLALVFLLLSLKYPEIEVFEKKKTTYWIILLLSISFFLYFSRTMWLAIFLLLLTAFGYAKINFKALKYIGLVLIIFIGFYVYLYSIDIKRDETGMSVFLYKMKIAPAEIFSPKVDLKNHAALWDHWRAYEAKMAFDQMKGLQYIIGRGFGSTVDLHFKAPLNEEGMRYISHLHNGYAMIYYKTGIIGLFFYLIFLLNLYLFTFYKKQENIEKPITNLIAAIGVYLLFSTLVITGAYNKNDIYLLALGGLFALYGKFLKSKPLKKNL